MELKIVSLYPRDMNIYGDRGNLLSLVRRARAHGITPEVVEVNVGDPLPDDVDIIIGGGGQDSGQERVARDLLGRGAELRGLAEEGLPMLLICGLYQLFGHRFVTGSSSEIPGIGVFDIETRAGSERMIGNVVVDSEEFGQIIGYENHSGNTVLGDESVPLGKVLQGSGNNTVDGTEGARTRNAIGSYLHGSLLPKNPAISDFLIRVAMERKYGAFTPREIDDTVALRARASAKKRPR
ncbi:type 1 glutamine amidotransferase [Leucobacter denitrificans]|uniref:Lipid II isoglutaminyl synthase (glutamine-hydrolyzing) subunit GatD n=1 Tax=Leucobacter denitrificans TaxID=683042 RepID=A0A7G9S5F4_9MICO|nr:glutamine amidotransferase [Leucobacter denitrificans]QNN63079.1 glutamine amidotransferase [Leucobacter denitrificans]